MVEINLLPWRAMVREENARQRKLFLMALIGLILVGLVSHIGLNWMLQTVDTRIADLQNQLTELTSQTQQSHFNPSLLIAEQIHSSQMELIHFFDNLYKTMQESVVWSEITNQKNHIVMTGNIDSFSILARFVSVYNEANKILPMTILSVKNNADSSAVLFHLQLTRAVSPFLSQIKNDDAIS